MGLNILNNLRILDFTWVLAGPYATRILADFGAEVIKIQPPMPEAEYEFSRGYYNMWNRNKRGITLNLNKPEGIELAKRLVGISDVVVENFTPRVMMNWGLDYPDLRKIKPDIIMLSMSAMGHSGPYRDYTGFGPTIHAFSGLTHLTSYPTHPPIGPGFAYADHVAGLCACMALLGALEQRRRTGEGQYIDISQVEATASLLGDAVLDYTLEGINPEPEGNASNKAAPHGIYPCKGNDRWCAIAVDTEEEWQRFKQVLDNPLLNNDKFNTFPLRIKNAGELDRLVAGWTKKHTPEEVMSLLQGCGIAAGVVQDARDLASDPQLKSRGFFTGLDKSLTDASPIKLSDNPARYIRPAPARRQDNDYVYRQLLGISEAEMTRLASSGII